MNENLHRLRGKLEVETEFGSFLGDTRIRLLEAIDKHGSISRAAKAVPLSYKAAWDAIDAMNNLSDQPLVSRLAGGRSGGGTTLTDHGRQVFAPAFWQLKVAGAIKAAVDQYFHKRTTVQR